MTYEINQAVVRVSSASDYTNGRKGTVVEIDETAGRYRVLWTQEANGREMKLRTWVKPEGLRAA